MVRAREKGWGRPRPFRRRTRRPQPSRARTTPVNSVRNGLSSRSVRGVLETTIVRLRDRGHHVVVVPAIEHACVHEPVAPDRVVLALVGDRVELDRGVQRLDERRGTERRIHREARDLLPARDRGQQRVTCPLVEPVDAIAPELVRRARHDAGVGEDLGQVVPLHRHLAVAGRDAIERLRRRRRLHVPVHLRVGAGEAGARIAIEVTPDTAGARCVSGLDDGLGRQVPAAVDRLDRARTWTCSWGRS